MAILYRLGKYEEAAAMSKAVKPSSKVASQKCASFFWQAVIQVQLGNLDEAKQANRHARELMRLHYPRPGFMVHGELTSVEPLVFRQEVQQILDSREEN